MPLVFDHVTYHYDTEILGPALDDVSLTVQDGEFVAFIGHTGSGKSTLAEHCNATKLPSSGTVTMDGLSTGDRKQRREVRRLVGFVAQYPEYQLFAETVHDDVAFGPKNLGMGADEVEQAVREAIRTVGLDYDEVAQKSPFDLSGGQKRRVALAGIIAMHPKVLVLDEPMVGLDPKGRREVFDIVRNLHSNGATIVMVSHSMDDVAMAAQRIVVLDHGRIVDQGTPAQVFSHSDLLHKVGLDIPLSTRVAHELKQRGFTFQTEPLTLDELADAIASDIAAHAGGAEGGERQ
jgi:energy-coupling factor transport system ATP-binding protein